MHCCLLLTQMERQQLSPSHHPSPQTHYRLPHICLPLLIVQAARHPPSHSPTLCSPCCWSCTHRTQLEALCTPFSTRPPPSNQVLYPPAPLPHSAQCCTRSCDGGSGSCSATQWDGKARICGGRGWCVWGAGEGWRGRAGRGGGLWATHGEQL